ncbi:MAG: magnesium/cobalt transporter CorA [Candidatus Sericytochromatia bacterium]|nr:magnesium/cobalt transporter CorA [Candidatus Sericytochromatia bacterium]
MITFALALDLATGRIDDVRYLEEALTRHADASQVVWIDLESPAESELEALRAAFGFHALTLEDCLHLHQRPKIEHHDGHSFIVLYAFEPTDGPEGEWGAREVMLFLGDRFVISIHPQPCQAITLAGERWQLLPGLEREAAAYLAYLIIDAAVDTYFPRTEALTDRLEDLENDIVAGATHAVLTEVMRLKRQTLAVRRLVTPLRDIFLSLMRGPGSHFGTATYAYFQDVLDHLLRITDNLDIQRDVLASAMDLHMSAMANRTNETMKKLTVASTILMTCALIAGIYGMNFRVLPELTWQYGYQWALGLMAGAAVVLLGLFRWRGYV